MSNRAARFAVAAASTAVGLGMLAPAAVAAPRYASPAGAQGATCASGDPCRLDTAVNNAVAGDEVILAPGDYAVTYAVSTSSAIDIHGQAGEAVPRLLGSASNTQPTLEMTGGGSISRVYASADGNSTALSLNGVIADGIEARAINGAYGIELYAAVAQTVLRNSISRADGGGAAIQVKDRLLGSTTIIGATALGTGGADGIVIKSTQSTTAVKNTIARGTHYDIEKKMTAIAPLVSYSNYRPANVLSINVGVANQSAAPQFADEAAGDLRPVAGSPTIDAGVADALAGLKDILGGLRVIGSAPDIGALEFDPAKPPVIGGGGNQPPTESTPPAGDPTSPPSGGGNPSTGDGNGSGGGDDAPALPPETKPVLGATVTLGDSRGALLVRLPGTDRFIPLTRDSTVPVGAVVDATNGTVELTSVRDGSGKTQSGAFWGGVFKVGQSRRDTVTELALTGGDFSDCRSKRRGKVTAAGSKRKRRLWGRDRGGRFRTRARNGSATVRGTRWLTEDRCDGTYFKVTDGAIDVRDDRKGKTVRLKRGDSYLAAAAAKRKNKR